MPFSPLDGKKPHGSVKKNDYYITQVSQASTFLFYGYKGLLGLFSVIRS